MRDLAVGYGGPAALTGVSFDVRPGDRIGVLGPNGGGKTTLFRALLGELAPLHGEISLNAHTAIVAQTERSRLDFPVTALDVALMGAVPRLEWWRRPGSGLRPDGRRIENRSGGPQSRPGARASQGLRGGIFSSRAACLPPLRVPPPLTG